MKGKEFSPEEFVSDLLNKGAQVSCDDNNDSFNRNNVLPEFYNEEKFKRGQKLYHDHIFGMFLSKLMGLNAVLAIPTILKILKFTNMSSEPMTAYKRYLGTIFHIEVWYSEEFKPGSDLWKSLEQVRGKHNFASKRSCGRGLNMISQMDMALTQFGFVGFIVCRSKEVGIHNVKDEDFEGFIHLWKVIGYLMGIEDRFNICRDSVEETRAICNQLTEKVFKPHIEMLDPDFVHMSSSLMKGMWCMMPFLSARPYLLFLIKIVNNSNEKSDVFNNYYSQLTWTERISYGLLENILSSYKYRLSKFHFNHQMTISLWLMKVFPFLAYYKFGKSNSHVHIMTNDVSSRDGKSG